VEGGEPLAPIPALPLVVVPVCLGLVVLAFVPVLEPESEPESESGFESGLF
jgi:hypothetical protein